MTLEQVHIKAISHLAHQIDLCRDDEDAKTASDLFEMLRELRYDGEVVLRSIGELRRSKVNVDQMALSRDPFGITYSCDSGSTNPISFDNGLFVDFCHCALASTPTDLGLHRRRTIVSATYSPSSKVTINTTDGWEMFDEDEGRCKIVRIQPGLLNKRIKRMVHNIAIYLSESEHILWMMDRLEKDGFFIMDGPIYPKQLMYWMVVESDDIRIRYDPHAKKILQNYIDIMDHHIGNRIPIVGFVKNPEDMQIMQTIKKQGGRVDIPWVMDAQFFKNALSLDRNGQGNNRYITYTNWFMQPNQFYEKMLDSTSPLVAGSPDHKFGRGDYSLTFFMVYVPMMDVIFKVESPYGITKNEDMRNIITRKILYDLSVSGVPTTLLKADSIAKIRLGEKEQIIGQFDDLKVDTKYNDIRWGENDD
ncbi:MAG TPA: DNA double-strand break repair nuclease NurA [Methanosarcinaceae archaeon]|nr:DNA double-strand break repair nuclease NurA [Methanosarcinaceae archaeon]